MHLFRLIAFLSVCLSLAALDSSVQIGGNYTYVWIKPSDNEQSQGSLGGAQALYEYRPANRFYAGAKLSWREGDTTCSTAKRSLLYIDVQERFGYTFSRCGRGSFLTLFSGFGYRYLEQHVSPLVVEADSFNGSFFPPYLTSATDSHLKYHEFYIPVGIAADYRVKDSISIGLYFTWMPQVFPMVDIVPLGNAYWALTTQLTNFLVEIPFTFTLTENRRWMLVVKPTYEYWQDGHSTAKTSTGIPLDLPGNTYQFLGLDLNFVYAF